MPTHKAIWGALIALTLSVPACSRGLSRDEAQAVIAQHRLMRATYTVSVEAISLTDAAEA